MSSPLWVFMTENEGQAVTMVADSLHIRSQLCKVLTGTALFVQVS